jgi:hypothetical protein
MKRSFGDRASRILVSSPVHLNGCPGRPLSHSANAPVSDRPLKGALTKGDGGEPDSWDLHFWDGGTARVAWPVDSLTGFIISAGQRTPIAPDEDQRHQCGRPPKQWATASEAGRWHFCHWRRLTLYYPPAPPPRDGDVPPNGYDLYWLEQAAAGCASWVNAWRTTPHNDIGFRRQKSCRQLALARP